MSKENQIFNYLLDLGACKACCLRFICLRHQDIFEDIDKYINEKGFLKTIENEVETTKKLKTNACIICLGLLQSSCIDETVDKIYNDENVTSYDSKVFTCSVSYPACIQIREFSINLDLNSKFTDFYTPDNQPVLINKAWKWIIKNKIAKKLNKTFEESDICNFSINVLMKYDLDIEELKVLMKMDPEYFKKRETQHRKFRGEIFSRKGVTDLLSQMKSGVFKEFAAVPPVISDKQVYCGNIECNHNSIFFAGRYNKYSRELPQTPWIINGIKQMDSSVQEIIFEPLQKFLRISEDSLKFSASGREDVDVRCLGNGRPFYIEYLNPKITQITFEQFRNIENDINISKDIKIRDLQIVPRDELSQIKLGEESKTKCYEALCVIEPMVTPEQINILNKLAPIEIKQKTPLRVLHRRPLSVRNKIIHKMNAEKFSDDKRLFKLSVTTQAGTYVKEFVHGDFGRTNPSVETLLFGNDNIDIVELDVTAVNLDWPKPVSYSNIEA